MDMPTPCEICNELVDFSDMVDVAAAGASIFVCEDCDPSGGFNGDPHTCSECKEECTCEYNPCICCNPDW